MSEDGREGTFVCPCHGWEQGVEKKHSGNASQSPQKWIFRDLLLPSGQVPMGSGCEDEAGAQDTRLEQKVL